MRSSAKYIPTRIWRMLSFTSFFLNFGFRPCYRDEIAPRDSHPKGISIIAYIETYIEIHSMHISICGYNFNRFLQTAPDSCAVSNNKIFDSAVRRSVQCILHIRTFECFAREEPKEKQQ